MRHSDFKRKENLQYAATWINVEHIMPCNKEMQVFFFNLKEKKNRKEKYKAKETNKQQ